jgi:MbtH protein
MTTESDPGTYTVVKNEEDRYSIWLVGTPPPRGWQEVGKTGPKDACLDHIAKVWTDMRPRSLREQLEEGRLERASSAG